MSGLDIDEAFWGHGHHHHGHANVTYTLREMVRGDGSIEMPATTNILGDPAPGQPKQLKVFFRRPGGEREEVIVPEGELLVIPPHRRNHQPPPFDQGPPQGRYPPFERPPQAYERPPEDYYESGPMSSGNAPYFDRPPQGPNPDFYQPSRVPEQPFYGGDQGCQQQVSPVLEILSARYESTADYSRGYDVTHKLRSLAAREGDQRLEVRVHNEAFDDPAPGQHKQLRVTFRRPNQSNVEEVVTQEDDILTIESAPSRHGGGMFGGHLQIEQAEWYAEHEMFPQRKDVTQILRDLAHQQGGKSLEVLAHRDVLGDPAEGHRKKLRVVFKKPHAMFTETAEVHEDETLRI